MSKKEIEIQGLPFDNDYATLSVYESPSGQTKIGFLSIGRITHQILDHYDVLPKDGEGLSVKTDSFNGIVNWTITDRL